MKLYHYLKINNITHNNFSKLIGVSLFSLNSYCIGRRIPRAAIIKKIEEVTCGMVCALDFYRSKDEEDFINIINRIDDDFYRTKDVIAMMPYIFNIKLVSVYKKLKRGLTDIEKEKVVKYVMKHILNKEYKLMFYKRLQEALDANLVQQKQLLVGGINTPSRLSQLIKSRSLNEYQMKEILRVIEKLSKKRNK